jgi:hypothetical protein
MTEVRVLTYRFTRPDGKVLSQWVIADNERIEPPLVRSDGAARWSGDQYIAPPWLLLVLDDGEWRTIDQRNDVGAVFLPGPGTATWTE